MKRMLDAKMNKENIVTTKYEQPNVRITRARARALGTLEGLPKQKTSRKQDQKVVGPTLKRLASDKNRLTVDFTACLQRKKRAVLKDVTDMYCDNSHAQCINRDRAQTSKQIKSDAVRWKTKVAPAILRDPHIQEDKTENLTKDTVKGRTEGLQLISIISPSKSKEAFEIQPKDGQLYEKAEASDGLAIANIDSDDKDLQMCCMYAPDIYTHLRVTELDRRPLVDYMEILQRDITHSMRGILIDWLVEVSDEYRLVPDTLYMTVNLIDRFLSKKQVEKKKLQLLGVTCMLIASKYEEICAPRIEEFCFITDNTYKREEVLAMESQILNLLQFQLSGPTTVKFLRRYIRAAQSSYKVPSEEFEFLANYLAELTLIEYGFLKFLPSIIAASAVFLSRWTLDQSDHPWNPTLEHYTSYKVSDLKPAVLGLQELQLNTCGSSLPAIREKYKQQKFKCVATLSSPKPVESLF